VAGSALIGLASVNAVRLQHRQRRSGWPHPYQPPWPRTTGLLQVVTHIRYATGAAPRRI
jgi:hypothetical protein